MPGIWVDDSRVELEGQTWAVRQAGVATGMPLVHFHGTPSSRVEPSFADDLCAELGVRLVCFDRPGYGDSVPARFSLSSVARSTDKLADRLGLDRFATVGWSGGGPFSLACGAILGDRVSGVGVVSGAGPFSDVPGLRDALDENDTAALALLPDVEAAAAQFAHGFEVLRAQHEGSDDDVIAGFRSLCSRRDNELLDREELAVAFVASQRLALVRGTSGAGWDNASWVGPWGFELADVRRPVHLWYGGEDLFVPAHVGPWLAERLPSATLHFRQQDGHFGVMDHTREIVETLISQ